MLLIPQWCTNRIRMEEPMVFHVQRFGFKDAHHTMGVKDQESNLHLLQLIMAAQHNEDCV